MISTPHPHHHQHQHPRIVYIIPPLKKVRPKLNTNFLFSFLFIFPFFLFLAISSLSPISQSAIAGRGLRPPSLAHGCPHLTPLPASTDSPSSSAPQRAPERGKRPDLPPPAVSTPERQSRHCIAGSCWRPCPRREGIGSGRGDWAVVDSVVLVLGWLGFVAGDLEV